MKYNPEIHKRKSIRLDGYDYAGKGFYFVTLCIQNRECLLGKIIKERIILNSAGNMVKETWMDLPRKFHNINLDTFIIMPNHLHGLITISNENEHKIHTINPEDSIIKGTEKDTIGRILQVFKTITTNNYINGVKENGWQSFPGKLWQRNYYERIIRNEDELMQTREYIINNPLKWTEDEENPEQKIKNNQICSDNIIVN